MIDQFSGDYEQKRGAKESHEQGSTKSAEFSEQKEQWTTSNGNELGAMNTEMKQIMLQGDVALYNL